MAMAAPLVALSGDTNLQCESLQIFYSFCSIEPVHQLKHVSDSGLWPRIRFNTTPNDDVGNKAGFGIDRI